MDKARITITVTKEYPLQGRTLEQLISEVDHNFYDFLTKGKPKANITGELIV